MYRGIKFTLDIIKKIWVPLKVVLIFVYMIVTEYIGPNIFQEFLKNSNPNLWSNREVPQVNGQKSKCHCYCNDDNIWSS